MQAKMVKISLLHIPKVTSMIFLDLMKIANYLPKCQMANLLIKWEVFDVDFARCFHRCCCEPRVVACAVYDHLRSQCFQVSHIVIRTKKYMRKVLVIHTFTRPY